MKTMDFPFAEIGQTQRATVYPRHSNEERPSRHRDFQQVLADCYAKIHEIEMQMQGTHDPD